MLTGSKDQQTLTGSNRLLTDGQHFVASLRNMRFININEEKRWSQAKNEANIRIRLI